MTVDDKLAKLRVQMREHDVDAVIIPSNDPHQSEYPATRWAAREWISGFTGSAGIVVVTQSTAGLWTDGRYYTQGEQQLAGTSMELFKYGLPDVPSYIEWLKSELSNGQSVSIAGTICAVGQLETLKKKICHSGINIVTKHDLVANIWDDQPEVPQREIFILEDKYTGETRADKLSRIRASMNDQGVDHHLISTLDDLAWILNIRGTDVEFNPVAVGYLIIRKKKTTLYMDAVKVPSTVKSTLEADGVVLKPYGAIIADLNMMSEDEAILIDPSDSSVVHAHAINGKMVRGKTISRLMKAIKNDTEISHTKDALVKDGVALAYAFYHLEQTLKKGEKITEADFADTIAKCRSEQADYVGESFPAIVGYKGNGAIIHYRPMHGACAEIKADGVLLADSGGQYKNGTTDITRTIALGTPTNEEKRNFTLVLKGHIELAKAKFPKGTTGGQLDILARKHLWAHGLNYGHGTGHGVGFFLNVHEPPQGIAPPPSPRAATPHVPGMYTSNEPGYYKEGAYGIRIENLIFTVESDVPGFLEFDTVTLYPMDLKMIDENIMTKSEKAWLNKYHNKVYKAIGPHLEGDIKTWFELKCRGMN